MTIEYSKYRTPGEDVSFCYGFDSYEKSVLKKAIPPEIKKLKKKMEKIRNDPRNEGQATFASEIDELFRKIQYLQEIEEEFTPKKIIPCP
jgi:hypothetical protein